MISKCNFSSIISPKLLDNKLQENDRSFQYFFSSPCSLITNHIQLPTRPNYLTDRPLTATTFSAKILGKLFQISNPTKPNAMMVVCYNYVVILLINLQR